METFELEQMCRLCGKQLHNTMAIHIFKSEGNYEEKIRTVLPIMIHEMDCLPKYLCNKCSDKLQEFYDFYIQTLKFDIHIKNQLSWMQNKPVVKSGITPTVYYADLRSLKMKCELENLEKFYTSKDNINLKLIHSENTDCSMEITPDDINNDNLNNSLSMSTTNDINQQENEEENNRLLSNETSPLFRINSDLNSNHSAKTVDDSTINFFNTMHQENEIPCENFLHNDALINTTSTITVTTGTNTDTGINNENNGNESDNCHVTLAKVLIESETNENDEFVRKLRPRQKIVNGESAEIAEKINENKSSFASRDNKPINLMSDSKLSKKVEIKIEKLEREAWARKVKIVGINENCNEYENIIDNYSSNMQHKMEKSTLENDDNIMGKIKSLKTQNNFEDIRLYEPKIKLHMEDITVDLNEINLAHLKKIIKSKSRKLRTKISKRTRSRKIHNVCARCKELFTKRELYQIHFCVAP